MIHWARLRSLAALVASAGPRQDDWDFARELEAMSELDRCVHAAAPALIFFCGRVVEQAVARQARDLHLAGRVASALRSMPLDEQINLLQQLGRLDAACSALLHEVRKQANRARHQTVHSSLDQGAFCLALLRNALPWMCAGNPALAGAVREHQEITSYDGELNWLMQSSPELARTGSVKALGERLPLLLASWRPVSTSAPTEMVTLVAQQCISAGALVLAGEVMAPFLVNRDPDHPQVAPEWMSSSRVSLFHRLVALRLSRAGRAAEAVAFLGGLTARAGYLADCRSDPTRKSTHAYVETLGILAGAYKSVWMNSGAPEALLHAASLYRMARQVQPWNSYIAINCAACEAWSGDVAAAQATALELYQQLEELDSAAQGRACANHWHDLAKAECLLIAGLAFRAVKQYRAIGSQFRMTHPGDLHRAWQQVSLHEQHGMVSDKDSATIRAALTHGTH
jgi:ABC-type transporter Mla MlaB component